MVHPRARRRSRAAASLVVVLCAAGVTGCTGAPAPASSTSISTASASVTSTAAPLPDMPATSPTPRARRASGVGKLVVLDPGHDGGNTTHPAQINRLVPAGRGVSKPCNTTGTATDSGYPEHAFNFAVAVQVAALLRRAGFIVELTRPNDSGVGPCVNERAAIGNEANADAVVSIHADGAGPSGRGFHVAYSAPPLGAAQAGPALRLARALRDGMRAAGIATSNYLGSAGLYGRDDLAGLNLSTRPAALIECGNMRNPTEAAAFTSASGRARYAKAIATGIAAYLAG